MLVDRSKPYRRPSTAVALLVALLLLLFPSAPAIAQGVTGTLSVTIDSGAAAPPDVYHLEVVGTRATMLENSTGEFEVTLAPGTYRVFIHSPGFSPVGQEVVIRSGETVGVEVTLDVLRFEVPGVTVTALRPDLTPQDTLTQLQIRQSNPRDVGEMLRELPGVDAVRRGPLGLDPVVSGLRETEIGVYLDDARIFPAGPARMDSALSHFDPSTVRQVEVVKGPYALTWGAGNMAAIRATTAELPPSLSGPLHGNVWGGHDSNLDAYEAVGQLFGSMGSTSYWVGGAYRTGDDYEAGDGSIVPADYQSAEGRAKLGFAVAPNSYLTVTGAYQNQQDLDYPGRILDAESFDATYLGARWGRDGNAGSRWDVSAYYNDVEHRMNNDGKPTALPAPGRMPPFPLEITIDTGSRTFGGRAAAGIDASETVRLELGADHYTVNRDAARRIGRRDLGVTIVQDVVWPDSDIADTGAFAKAETVAGEVSLAVTARLDQVSASADPALVTDFFRNNTTGDLESDETNLSGSLNVSVPLDDNWSLAAGAGSVVRTADTLERYSDRFPASKAQLANEFMGNPEIRPERSTQADVWLDARFRRWSLSANAFVRKIDDYITLEPTGLPKKLPLSPPTVFRYVNGEASFWGVDATVSLYPSRNLTFTASSQYLRGDDDLLDEPALGVTPFRVDLAGRYDVDAWFGEARLHAVAEQDRVATLRGETPTAAYETVDLRAGWRSGRGFEVTAGVNNLFDEAYTNHLNSKNPFLRAQILEPGRVVYFKTFYSF